ncbi:MAG: C-terminal binding protein [Chloroflexi bacterium]|nr:C-terminal binding protein [Chloroflexota bacterium]
MGQSEVNVTQNASRFKVLITDYVWPNTNVEREVLERIGAEAIEAVGPDEERLAELAADCDAILTCFAKVTDKVIRSAPNLQVVARYGVGVDNISVDTATALGIPVTYVPDYCIEEVADHSMALLLTLARSVVNLNAGVRSGGWDPSLGRPVYRFRGKVVGIVGYGRIGRAVAARARAFGFEIAVHDPYLTADMFPAGQAPTFVSFDELLATSDFVSVHTPLTTDTRHLIGEPELKKMKSSAFLINTCRGPVIDEYALAQALDGGELAGAGIDVLEGEPPPSDHPIRSARNAVITPHTAFYSEESLHELQRRTAQCAADVLSGKVPENIYNADALASAGQLG